MPKAAPVGLAAGLAGGAAGAVGATAASVATGALISGAVGMASSLISTALGSRQQHAETQNAITLRQTPYTSAKETERAATMGYRSSSADTGGGGRAPIIPMTRQGTTPGDIPQFARSDQPASQIKSTQAGLQDRLNGLIMRAGSPQLRASRLGAGGLG